MRIAQTSEPFVALTAAQVDLARSDVASERRWPNPALDYTRESAGETEEFATLSQSFDFSGRRALRRRAAELLVEAAQLDAASQKVGLAHLVRSQFSRTANQQELVSAHEAWSKKIASAADTAARLQAGGEVSGYDRRRLDRERIGAEARLTAERGALLASQTRLATLLGVERLDGVTLERSGTPEIPSDSALAARLEQRPDLAAIAKRIEAATMTLQAAQRWRVPLFDLTAGMKSTEATNGLIVGAGVSLPVFDRNQDELLRANSQLAILNAQRALLITRARGDATALAAEARSLRAATRMLREQALPTAARLTATAEVAYRAGEVGILELLDAYRTALDAELELADLEQRAHQTAIELLRVIGGEPNADMETIR